MEVTHIAELIPEIIMLIAAGVVLMVGLAPSDGIRKTTQVLAVLALLAAFISAIPGMPGNSGDAAAALAQRAPWARYISLLTSGIGLLSVLAAWNMPVGAEPSEPDRHNRGEFFAMLLFSLAGVSMVAKVTDLIWLFLVLELVSIPTYILVATGRSQIIAQEAGVKYFFLGALSAAIYLFGFSYLYGYAGSTRYVDIAAAFQHDAAGHTVPYIALIGLILVLIGVAYKIAAVPLHFYTPDVYQGAATPVTAFLAFAPKAAGIVAILSLLHNFQWLPQSLDADNPSRLSLMIPALLTVMAVLTMTVGNILALLQRNIKRMFAYSSIAHSGYMLVGLAVGVGESTHFTSRGYVATLFYLGAYSLMNLGAFAVLIYLQGKTDAAEDVDDLAGVSKEHPLAALAMMICLFSLIGMPGTIGFLGKLYIVLAALSTGHVWLAVIVMLNAAVAAAYYLRIIAAMYLRDTWTPFTVRKAFAPQLAACICTVAVIVFGILPGLLLVGAGENRPQTAPNVASVAAAKP